MKISVQEGPYKGERLDAEKWEQMLDRYYDLHGWDKDTGWPTRRGLASIGLKGVADRLIREGISLP